VGIDVGDYNQTVPVNEYADRYIVVTSDTFPAEIRMMVNEFDAVISSHNIEHCDAPIETLKALLLSLKNEGRIYLSFPCQESVAFPRRKGTLNFFDDPTHRWRPDLAIILDTVRAEGFRIEFLAPRYRPLFFALIGLFLEPLSFILKRNMPWGSTWALYGFETVIWASRRI